MRTKEKKTEPNQIPAGEPETNKRIKKKSNFTSLAGNRTRSPCHISHLPSPTFNLTPHTHIQAYPQSSPSTNLSFTLYALLFYETSS
jgi:hypothetical protein